jgi:hypothetical protein
LIQILVLVGRLFNPVVTSYYKTSIELHHAFEPSYASFRMIMRLCQVEWGKRYLRALECTVCATMRRDTTGYGHPPFPHLPRMTITA